jgi:hypothetical protein
LVGKEEKKKVKRGGNVDKGKERLSWRVTTMIGGLTFQRMAEETMSGLRREEKKRRSVEEGRDTETREAGDCRTHPL